MPGRRTDGSFQAIWAALNIIFVGGDLFNLYVALELLTFAAVPLVCIDGRPETIAAALRYLLFALFGSIKLARLRAYSSSANL